jgi:lysM domain/M23/M37 peptidase domain protein
MMSDALFFQDYQKRNKHSFKFWQAKKKSPQTLAFSPYVGILDIPWFDNSVPNFRKKSTFHLESHLVKKIFVSLVLAGLTLCMGASIYYVIKNATSGIKSISFQKEESVDKFLTSFVNLHSEVSEAVNLPSIVKEVKYTDYIVKRGDTISGIAYKMGLKNIGTIFSANNVTNAKRIMSGTHLSIPSMDGILYTVKKNDSLDSIAKDFNIPLEALLDANDLNDIEISFNTRLFIPGASLSITELRKAMGELFIYPIQGRLTSPFGYRRDPFTGRKSFHSGIDLAAPEGTKIKVILDGTVSLTSYSRIFGNYMIVTHPNGYQSLYGHLSRFNAKKGEQVSQGDIIALVGNTGLSTGPHVHLSIYKNGKLIDPLSVLK